jgi:hypothetical protein
MAPASSFQRSASSNQLIRQSDLNIIFMAVDKLQVVM